MQVKVDIRSKDLGTWGYPLEYLEVDESLASERDVSEGTWRIRYLILYRKPGSREWLDKVFTNASERHKFLETWFQNRETADGIPLPTPEEMYLPLCFIGQEVSSLVFVMDYVQLVTHDAGMNLYSLPEVWEGEACLKHGDLGYCDALARLIGEHVITFEEQYGEFLELSFTNSTRLVIPWDEALTEFADMRMGDRCAIWPY